MKRRIVSLLAVLMVCLVQVPGLAATEETYAMEVLVNGAKSCQVEQGGTVTVSLTMTKKGASNFDLYCMQDYVCFDPNYFQYVEGSLDVYTAGGDWKTPVFQASAVSVPAGQREDNRIFVNRASDKVQKLPSGVTVLSFQLKALKNGSTDVTHAKMEVFRDPTKLHDVSGQSAAVTIGTVGDGESTPTTAPEPGTNPQPTPTPQGSVTPNQKPETGGAQLSDQQGTGVSQSEETKGDTEKNEEAQPAQPGIQEDAETVWPTASEQPEKGQSEKSVGASQNHLVLAVTVVLVLALAAVAAVFYQKRRTNSRP